MLPIGLTLARSTLWNPLEQHRKPLVKVKLNLTKRTVDALKPDGKSWIARDDKLTGFGVRVYPSGAKAFLVNYRAGNGGRKAPNKRVVVGRVGRVTPDRARRLAQELLGRGAAGDDPAGERADARTLPTLGDACEGLHGLRPRPRGYGRYAALNLGDWLARPLDAITSRDIETRFQLLIERHGAVPANPCPSFLRSVYRKALSGLRGSAQPCGAVACERAGTATARHGGGYRLWPKCLRASGHAWRQRCGTH